MYTQSSWTLIDQITLNQYNELKLITLDLVNYIQSIFDQVISLLNLAYFYVFYQIYNQLIST